MKKTEIWVNRAALFFIFWLITEDGLWGLGQAEHGAREPGFGFLLIWDLESKSVPFYKASLHPSEKWSLRNSCLN